MKNERVWGYIGYYSVIVLNPSHSPRIWSGGVKMRKRFAHFDAARPRFADFDAVGRPPDTTRGSSRGNLSRALAANGSIFYRDIIRNFCSGRGWLHFLPLMSD